MTPKYYTPEELVGLIAKPNRQICQRILLENREFFQAAPGSSHNHQAWPGGYWDHVGEVMNWGYYVYELKVALRPPSFCLSDVLLVLFLHDLEKPWKYAGGEECAAKLVTKKERQQFRLKKITEYGINLTPEQGNALKYVEGEGDDYSSECRVMGSLAALCHVADIISARGYPNHPLAKDDPWTGAKRCRS